MAKVQVCRHVPELWCTAAAAPVRPSLEEFQVLACAQPVALLSAAPPTLSVLLQLILSSLAARLRTESRAVRLQFITAMLFFVEVKKVLAYKDMKMYTLLSLITRVVYARCLPHEQKMYYISMYTATLL